MVGIELEEFHILIKLVGDELNGFAEHRQFVFIKFLFDLSVKFVHFCQLLAQFADFVLNAEDHFSQPQLNR